MMSSLSILMLAGYFLIVLLVAQVFSRKIENLKDFFLAGRSLSVVPVALTFVASWFGAGSTMGSINAFHELGLEGLWPIVLPSVGSCLIITLLIAKRVARHEALSQPEAVESYYGRFGRFLLALMILASTTSFVGSQMVAAGKIFETFFGLELVMATLLCTAVVVLYSMVGGYFAVVVTDMAQFLFFTIGLAILAVFAVMQVAATPEMLTHFAASHPPEFWDPTQNLSQNLALWLTFVVAWCIAPEMWQRMSSTKSEQVAVQSAGLATMLLMFLFGLVITIGLLSTALVGQSDAVMVELAMMLPHPVLTILVMVGFIAAVTSSMDSSINVGSLTLTRDLYQGFFRPQASDRELLWVSRMATVLMVGPAMAIALYFQNIIQVLWIAADIYASTMFFPVIGILFFKNPGRLSGVLAMLFGGSAVIISALVQHGFLHLPIAWPGWPYSTLIGVLMSGVGFGLGYWLSRQESVTLEAA